MVPKPSQHPNYNRTKVGVGSGQPLVVEENPAPQPTASILEHSREVTDPRIGRQKLHQFPGGRSIASSVTQTVQLTFALVVIDSHGLTSAPDIVVITVEPYRILLPMILR
jgi:hypothetical protein